MDIKDIEKQMSECESSMTHHRTLYNSFYKRYNELSSYLSKEKEDFFELKEGSTIELIESIRVGSFGFITTNNKPILIEVLKLTDKFIRGNVLNGRLVKFKGKSSKYDSAMRSTFTVNKEGFISMISTNSNLGKILDRDKEINNMLNN